MSPEQVRGERADARSDVFALGCVFYELLTYQKPFDADSMHSVLFKVMQEDPRPLREVSPDVPAVLAQVVERAMSKDGTQRFQNASEFRTALHRAMQAVAAGRGDAALPELAPPPASVAAPRGARGADASGAASGARSSPAMREAAPATPSRAAAPGRPAPPPPSKVRLIGALAGAVVAVAVGGFLFAHRGGSAPPSPPPATRPAQVDPLAQELARSQVELARRRAEAGDFRDALRQAERALKIDPTNKDAQEILGRAKATADEVDKAAATARQAAGVGDATAAATAVWTLLQKEPANPAVDEVAPKVVASLRPRAEEARRGMAQARQAAEGIRAATALDTFKEGADLARQGEAELKAGRTVAAARRFLAARDRFERAARSAR
jgi:serine/threonine-protein kinase